MGFLDGLFGKKEQFKQISNMDPTQMGVHGAAGQNIMSLLGQGGGLDPRANEAEARGNFMGKTVPGIAEMFTSMGQGGQRSGAFAGALGSAGANLERGLASDRSNYNMQLLQSLMGPAMQSSFDTYHEPGTQGLMSHLAGPGLQMAAQGGVFGRGVMNSARGQGGQAGQSGMNNLMQMLPFLMML
jgi:hypothetical protein